MDTQNTPIHLKLWHRDFWLLAFAYLLLSMSAYMLVPALPPHLLLMGTPSLAVASVMGVFGVGLFLFGPFCSYWVERYRRNRVCLLAIAGLAACILALLVLDAKPSLRGGIWIYALLRLLMGACYGLAVMVLAGVLVVDTCESFVRTEANHAAGWFARFAMALGPAVSLLVFRAFDYEAVVVCSAALAVAAGVLLMCVHFPFKAPSESAGKVSLDRFLLRGSWPLFVSLTLLSTIVGLLLSMPQADKFFAMMLVGLVFALLAEKYAFHDANLKSEVVTGLVVIAAAQLVPPSNVTGVVFIAPTLFGFGIGIIGSRFLLFFTKLAGHCQRGTSQSTCFLASELGISVGLFLGLGVLWGDQTLSPHHMSEMGAGLRFRVRAVGIGLVVVNFLFYNFFVHPWYVSHKNR